MKTGGGVDTMPTAGVCRNDAQFAEAACFSSFSMATAVAPLAARPITLEQLAALSDEIAALARAGVPLDRGLRELARDLPGRLGKLAGAMGTRLEEGRPLDGVVEDLGAALPPAYRSVIAAGIRAGHLPAA